MTDDSKPNITTTQIILFLFVFTLFVIIGISIGDKNLKISYFLVVSLILFTLFNCYLTISYYTNLRDIGGRQGERGLKGQQGFKGDSGVCTFSDKCGIPDCKDKIENASKDYNKDYDDLKGGEECYNDPTNANCNDDEESKKKALHLKNLNKERIKHCKESKLNWEELKEILFPPLN